MEINKLKILIVLLMLLTACENTVQSASTSDSIEITAKENVSEPVDTMDNTKIFEVTAKEQLANANSNAKNIYNTVLSYSTNCEIAGYIVDEGWYFTTLSDEKDTSYKNNGKDLKIALNNEIGQIKGFSAIKINNTGYPVKVLWSHNEISPSDVDELLNSKSLNDNDIDQGPVFGRYPEEIMYEKDGKNMSTFDPLDLLIEANSNAKNVYCNAAVYATDCEVRGYHISTGWHICKLEMTDNTELKKDGTDFDDAMCSYMGNYGGYGAVYIGEEGYPVNALWSPFPLNESSIDELANKGVLSAKEIDSEGLVGRYPQNIEYFYESSEDDHGSAIKSKMSAKELLEEANSEAKMLFTNVAVYDTQCEIEGNCISEGWYTFEVTYNPSYTYLKDGKDMKNAVSYLMGDTTGYAAVHISAEGYPDDVIWCHYPITFDDIDDLTKIVSMKKDEIYYDTVVGRYPDEIVMK